MYGGSGESADLGCATSAIKSPDPLDWRRPGSLDVRVICG